MPKKLIDLFAYFLGVGLQFLSIFLITELMTSKEATSTLLFLSFVSVGTVLARAGTQPNMLKFRNYKRYFISKIEKFHLLAGAILSFLCALVYWKVSDTSLTQVVSYFLLSTLLVFFALYSIRFRIENRVFKSIVMTKLIDKTVILLIVVFTSIYFEGVDFFTALVLVLAVLLVFFILKEPALKTGGYDLPSRKFILHCKSAVTVSFLLILIKNLDVFILNTQTKEFAVYISANKYSEIFYMVVPFINIYFMKAFLGGNSVFLPSGRRFIMNIAQFYLISLLLSFATAWVVFNLDLSMLITEFEHLRGYLEGFFIAKITLVLLAPFNLLFLHKKTMLFFTISIVAFTVMYSVILYIWGNVTNAPYILAACNILMFTLYLFSYVYFVKKINI